MVDSNPVGRLELTREEKKETYLKIRRITIPPRTIIRSTLRNRPRKINILERKIRKRDIPRPTPSGAASIRRKTLILPRPRLDSSRIPRIHTSNIPRRDIFNDFNLARILSDATHGESLTVVERAIGNINIRGILFHADAIVAVVDGPAEKCDVVGVHGIDAVGVDVGAEIAVAVGAGGVDVNVL